MKYLILIISLAAVSSFSHAQLSKKHEKKIQKIVGKDLLTLIPQTNYTYSDVCANCGTDSSTTNLNDTTGVWLNGEYLLFRSPIHYKIKNELAKMIHPEFVTVAEFQQFQRYVTDSIARDKIYFSLEEDDNASRFLNYSEVYYSRSQEVFREFDPSERSNNRSEFNLNWKRKFYYEDPDLVPILADMYFPTPERFYGNRELDPRKFNYVYSDFYEWKAQSVDPELKKTGQYIRECYRAGAVIEQRVNALNDDFTWSRRAESNTDAFGVLGLIYSKAYQEQPVIGVLGTQATAYCHWKQDQLQKAFDAKKIPYSVVVTLPVSQDVSKDDLRKFSITGRDFASQWKITNAEYDEFVAAVLDSVIREYLYVNLEDMDEAASFLNYYDLYLDEGALEYREFDPADRFRNRRYFSLNYDKKINMKDPVIAGLVEQCKAKLKGDPHFTYFQYLSKERAHVGVYVEGFNQENESRLNLQLLHLVEGQNLDFPGYDLNLSWCNRLGHCPGVRSHRNFQRFIEENEITTMRLYEHKIPSVNEEDLATDISYTQAIAFYHWKYPIHRFKEGDDWQHFIFPTEEEFQQVLSGKAVLKEDQLVEFPTPLFRYVVHVYPK